MLSHADAMLKHTVKRFNERFKKEDFTYKSKKYGTVDFTEVVANCIVNAPKKGKYVRDAGGNRSLFKVEVCKEVKPVYVIWDKNHGVPATVLTGKMV